MAINNNYLQSGFGRVWVAQGQVGCSTPYTYHNCMQVSGLSDPAGDVSYEYCPSESSPNQFVVVSEIEGEPGNVGFTMRGPVPRATRSILRQLREKRCAFDVQIKYADCPPMTDAENYIMQYVIEGARVSGYSVPELIARNPSGRALLEEEVTVTAPADSLKQIYALNWASIGNTELAQGRIVDVVVCDEINCGGDDCGNTPSDGCQKILALQVRVNGLHLLWTQDGGASWSSTPVRIADNLTNRQYLVCCNNNVYVAFWNAVTLNIYTSPLTSVFSGTPAFTVADSHALSGQATGMVCVDNKYIAVARGDDLIVLDIVNGTSTTTTPGVTSISSVSVGDDNGILVGGANGQVAYSSDLASWTTSQAYFILDNVIQANAGAIQAIHAVDRYNWIAFDEFNLRYCTSTAGSTWSSITSVPHTMLDMGSRSIGLASNGTDLYRTSTLWNSSKVQTLPANGGILSVLNCPNDANLGIVAGVDSSGTGGYIAIGKPN